MLLDMTLNGVVMNPAKVCDIECLVDDSGLRRNALDAIRRDLPAVKRQPEKPGRLAIVASGPSAADYLDELREWDGEIWAINGAFCWLIGEGIIPHGFICLDPGDGVETLLTDIPEASTYYIAVICNPAIFDRLKDRNVKLWYSVQGPEFEKLYPKGATCIKGGTTCLTRAPYLAYEEGWRDITIYGGDSSFRERVYCYDESRYECSVQPTVHWIQVEDEVFPTNFQMAYQASNMLIIAEVFGPLLKFRGDGLLPALLNAPIYDMTVKAA